MNKPYDIGYELEKAHIKRFAICLVVTCVLAYLAAMGIILYLLPWIRR